MIENKKLEFSLDKNSIDLLYDDDRFCVVSIDLMHQDDTLEDCNRNMCNISHEAILKSIPTIYNTTISCIYNSEHKDFVTDVVEHYANERELFETHIVGHIPTDARVKFVKRDNGKTYLNVEAIIHKNLEPKIIEIIEKNDGKIKVSTVFKAIGEQDKDTGIFVVDEWTLITTTLLGEKFREGIEGSKLTIKKISKEQLNTANERYMQFAYNGNKKDIYDIIKNKKEKEIEIVNVLGTRELESRIWAELKKYKYTDGHWTGFRYYIENILPDTKEVIVQDNQMDKLYKIPYVVSDKGDVTIDEEKRTVVSKDVNYREVKNSFEFNFAKEDYGTGGKIEIDKSKDSMSETEWGKINKIALRNKILLAENYKELVNSAYLVVEEGWEEAPSEKLKYPVMEIVDNKKLVYNRHGLASALGFAKANKEKEVIKKLEKIYKDLDLDKKEDKEDKDFENAKTEVDIEKEFKALKKEHDKLLRLHDEIKEKYEDLKKDHEELKEKHIEIKESNAKYKDKEDKEYMHNYLKTYKKSFSNEEYEILASEIEKSNKKDFEMKVDEKIKEFVRKMSEEDEGCEKEFSNSYGFLANYTQIPNKELTSIDQVLEQLK